MQYHEFKSIRNRLRQSATRDVVLCCSTKLREIEYADSLRTTGWLPWHLLLLIRWSIEYGGTTHRFKPFTVRDLRRLQNFMNSTGHDEFLSSNQPHGVLKFFRRLSFQQFWTQNRLSRIDLARQYHLFCNSKFADCFDEMFRRNLSNSIRDCLALGFAVLAWIRSNPAVAQTNSERLGRNLTIPSSQVTAYLRSISLDLHQAKDYLASHAGRVRSPERQVFEVSPLVRYPFCRLGSRYFPWSGVLFEHYYRRCIYGKLRELCGSVFAQFFGECFENYVHERLAETGISFQTEKQLQSKFPGQKIADFVIQSKGATIIVETKAIVMNASAYTFPVESVLASEFRTSLLKGISQCYSTAHLIASTDRPVFAVLISYDSLFLGGGADIWAEFAGPILGEELKTRGISDSLIAPRHIIAMSLDEWDQLLIESRGNAESISSKLALFAERSSDEARSVFAFDQILDHPESPAVPPMLARAEQDLHAAMRELFADAI